MPKLITYKHYKIAVQDDGQPRVYDPRFPEAPPVYFAKSIDDAKQFITGYRNGAAWADNAVMDQRSERLA